MLSVAFAARLGSAGCEWARLVVSALAAKPRIISGVNAILHDLALDEKAYEAVAEAAYKQCHPLINVPYDHEYRREMVPVYVRRALREALGAEAAGNRADGCERSWRLAVSFLYSSPMSASCLHHSRASGNTNSPAERIASCATTVRDLLFSRLLHLALHGASGFPLA